MDSMWPHVDQQSGIPSGMRSEMMIQTTASRVRHVGIALCLLWGGSLLSGCVAQQADLKQVDRDLQKRIKQSTEELAQTRARYNQEIVALKEQELPALRGELDRALHRAQTLESRQEDIQAKIDAKLAGQDSKLEKRIAESEKRAAERSAEENRRLGWAEQQLVNQERQLKADRDQTRSEVAALTAGIDQLRGHIDAVQKNILEAVQKTNAALGQKVDSRLDEQQKAIHAVENRQAAVETRQGALTQLEVQNKVLTEQVGKFNQALGDFHQVLNKLGEKIGQQEQATKQVLVQLEQETTAMNKRADVLAGRIDADSKATAEYLSKVNKSVESMHKALEQAGGKFVNRGEEQERRLDDVSKEMAHVQGQIQAMDKNLENQHTFLKQVEQHLQSLDKASEHHQAFLKQVEQHLQSLDKNYENHQVFLKQVEQHLARRTASAGRSESGVAVAEAATPPPAMSSVPAPEPVQQPAPSTGESHAGSAAGHTQVASVSDREAYERILNRFKEGDLESARQGFADFIARHPNSDFAPNARFWLGESYYGKKDYPKAIDAYDQVQLNHPTSEKVPAALLKKGYAYLALKDRKRAASALKQVIDLYPRSPEASKAIDKLNQLKELH
jgi:tol-pal system protein YbgF